MGIGAISVVADAGPLIHLYEIELFELLACFAEVHIPVAVWEESTRQGRIPPDFLESCTNLTQHTIPDDDYFSLPVLSHLHTGEQQGLYLCEQLQVAAFLTDDLAARQIAKQLGLTPVGSVGVIAKCCVDDKISLTQAESALWQLYETSTLFVTKKIVDDAIETLRRHFL